MKVILYMAITANGYVATTEGDSDWVSEVDADIFEGKAKEYGCILVGSTTFDQYYGDLYPMDDALNIVLTGDSDRGSNEENVAFVSSPEAALKLAEERGYSDAMLIGGGTVNSAFFDMGVIDEVYLTVHPLLFGEGIKLFEKESKQTQKLDLLDTKTSDEGLVQLHYAVQK